MARQPNSGSFAPGPDPRRHVFSAAERRKGFRVAALEKKLPSRLRSWLRRKIRLYYRAKKEK
jgi:hypothetical protein